MPVLKNIKHERMACALAGGATKEEAVAAGLPNVDRGDSRFQVWVESVEQHPDIMARVAELTAGKQPEAQPEPKKKPAPKRKAPAKKAAE